MSRLFGWLAAPAVEYHLVQPGDIFRVRLLDDSIIYMLCVEEFHTQVDLVECTLEGVVVAGGRKASASSLEIHHLYQHWELNSQMLRNLGDGCNEGGRFA